MTSNPTTRIEVISSWPHHAVPEYATPGSAAVDLRAFISVPITLFPGDTVLIPTGIRLNIKDPYVAAMILPRSGLGHKLGMVLGNGVGLIDSDYQEEVMISAWNRSLEDTLPIQIEPRMRIAQMFFTPVTRIELEAVSEFTEETSQ